MYVLITYDISTVDGDGRRRLWTARAELRL